ncbi:MAG: hypothetical protein JXB15_06725 [Anaerolineales bacterium]|nr:hypothetical protein [Anaerolineales bacterium]
MAKTPGVIVRLFVELVKYQAEQFVGPSFRRVLSKELADIAGEELNERLAGFLDQGEQLENLREAFHQADQMFARDCKDDALHQLIIAHPLADLAALEELARHLPETLDSEGLRSAIRAYFDQVRLPRMSEEQIDLGASIYQLCLERSLAATCGQLLPGIFAKTERIESNTQRLIEMGTKSAAMQEQLKQVQEEILARLPAKPPLTLPYQVPGLPSYFVRRPEITRKLIKHLRGQAKGGRLLISAVHGMGGVGKTTLAAALARDPRLEKRFPHGVLWVTLGQQPDVLTELIGWIQELGDYQFKPLIIDTAAAHLRSLLKDRACLLVVDDAWQAAHAEPFMVGGEQCQMLITTRDASLASKLKAKLFDLDVLDEPQALALLSGKLGGIKDADQPKAAALAKALGYHPLALELAAAQVEEGRPWDELVQIFQGQAARLEALDLDEPTRRTESLRLCFRASLELLSPAEREAFAWLGVLAEEAHIRPALASVLWSLSEDQAVERLRRFKRKALLKNLGENEYALHDLLLDEARQRLLEQMSWEEAQVTFLERLRSRTRDGLWHTLPEDGYNHAHLTWHMQQAGLIEAIHALLREETPEGRNGWFEACDRLGDLGIFLADLHRAWYIARNRVGLQCRYSLILTTINTLAGSIPPDLLNELVRTNVWNPLQALAYARQDPHPVNKSMAISYLIPYLPEKIYQEPVVEALQAVRGIRNLAWKAEALSVLLPYLPDGVRTQLLIDVLPEIKKIWDEDERAIALSNLAPFFSENLVVRALNIAHEIEEEKPRVIALSGLAPYLPMDVRLKVIREAKHVALKIRNPKWMIEALVALAPNLPEQERTQVFFAKFQTILLINEDLNERIEKLVFLVPYLFNDIRSWVITEAFQCLKKANSRLKAEILSSLAPYLPKDQLSQAFGFAWGIEEYHSYRTIALTSLIPYMPQDLLVKALLAVQSIENDGERAILLTSIAPYLSHETRQQIVTDALDATRFIGDDIERVEALVALAPCLSEEQLEETMNLVFKIRDDEVIERALSRLVPNLSPKQLEIAMHAAGLICGEVVWVNILVDFAPKMPLDLLMETLQRVYKLYDKWSKARALSILAGYLPEANRLQAMIIALDTIEEIESENLRAHALSELVPHLPEVLYEKAYQIVIEIKDFDELVTALSGLTPHLPMGLLMTVLQFIPGIGDKDARSFAFVKTVTCLPENIRSEKISEALQIARGIEYEIWRADALTMLIPYLSQEFRHRVLEETLLTIWGISDEDIQLDILVELTKHLPEDSFMQTLQAIGNIVKLDFWIRFLSRLASRLPENKLVEVFQADQKINDIETRTEAFIRLAPYLAVFSFDSLESLWQETLPILASRTRRDLLSDLAALEPMIFALGGQEAIVEVFHAIQDVGRWWP